MNESNPMITCPRCEATTRQIKAGKTKAGAQKYRCTHCNRMYVVESKAQSDAVIPESEPTHAIQLYTPAEIPLLTTTAPIKELQSASASEEVDVPLPTITTLSVKELKPALVSAEGQVASSVARAFPAGERGDYLWSVLDRAVASNSWGWLPEIAVLHSAGMLLIAWAFVNARVVAGSSDLFLWVSLAIMILPTALRLASAEPSRRERIGLVLLLGMSLYLVKVMHSPLAFTFPDELSHMRNVVEILQTHRLFQDNPIQPVTALYPGLPTVTSTLVSVSGLSIFSAGFLVIGAARLIVFLSLFLLYEQVSGSARIAGLATLLYMANPNFLYWTSEYAYEPLALPLVVFVLYAVAKREMAVDQRHHLAWTVAAISGVLTVIITHHMSSYILTAILCALTLFSMIRSRGWVWGPWDLALVALVATSTWLLFVASMTINYLSPVLFGAIKSIFNMISEEESNTRQLFKSGSSGKVAPLWERLVAMSSVVLIALGLPFGAYEVWKKYQDKVIAILLAAIALVYLPMQVLRFTKDGWETANRSSEFLFIGIAFLLALGIIKFWLMEWPGWNSRTVFSGVAVILFFGGLIAGWPPKARLPRPYEVYSSGHLIKPQVVTVAEWMASRLGTDNRVAASKADAKIIGAYGQYPFTGDAGGIKDMFFSEGVGPSERGILSRRSIKYIISDRKVVSWDHMIGYYFYNKKYSPSQELEVIDPQIYEKFDGLPGVNRILDTGDIIVYDIEMYLASTKEGDDATRTNSPTVLQTSLPVIDTQSLLRFPRRRETHSLIHQTYSMLAAPAPVCTWQDECPEWGMP